MKPLDMPARIEKRDKGAEEPPPRKKRVSANAEVARSCTYSLPSISLAQIEPPNLAAGKRRRHLNDLDGPERHQPIPKNKFIDDWFGASDWSRERKTSNNMSNEMPQLPESAITASSGKSAASVHDPNYRASLQQYNIYIMGKEPDLKFIEQVNNIISRRRDTPELDDTAVRQLRATMRAIQNEGEEDVRERLGALIIPGYNTPPDGKLHSVSGQLWTKSIPVPLDLNNALAVPLPLPKPKPDKAFGYSTAAFNSSQLSTINLLTQGWFGPSFASPLEGLRFPFFVIEFKSQAKDGSIRVARNQAAGAGAIALNGILELLSCSSGLDDFYLNQPLFFSVTMDQEFAGVNAHWIGKRPDTNQYTFHLEELKMLPLKYDDSIHVLQRAIKNIFDYAAGPRLEPILEALDEYRKNIIAQKAAESVEKTRDQVEPRTPPSPALPPPPSKKIKGMVVSSKNGGVVSKAQGETTR